jgi:hypothetical protein
MGIKEEIITIVTSANSDAEGRFMLEKMGLFFRS